MDNQSAEIEVLEKARTALLHGTPAQRYNMASILTDWLAQLRNAPEQREPLARYTQPCIQTMPGPVFQTQEVELFEDPRGKWVRYQDIEHLLAPEAAKAQVPP